MLKKIIKQIIIWCLLFFLEILLWIKNKNLMQFTLPVIALGFTMTESGPLESIGLLMFTSLEQKNQQSNICKIYCETWR